MLNCMLILQKKNQFFTYLFILLFGNSLKKLFMWRGSLQLPKKNVREMWQRKKFLEKTAAINFDLNRKSDQVTLSKKKINLIKFSNSLNYALR